MLAIESIKPREQRQLIKGVNRMEVIFYLAVQLVF